MLRNLGRGYTRQDMNVSFVKEKRLRLRGKLAAVGQRVRQYWADHSELSQFADRFASRFLRAVRGSIAELTQTPAAGTPTSERLYCILATAHHAFCSCFLNQSLSW